jgi:hypothetical protein
MFHAARKMFGDRGSLLSAVVYQLLPYHLIDLYHRVTFAELFAYAWLPLFFYFLVRTQDPERSTKQMAGLSFVYAGLICTHLVTGFLFTLFAGAFLLYRMVSAGWSKSLLRTAVPLLLGLGISSVYLWPAVFERRFVHLYVLLKGQYYFTGNFLFDFRGHLFEIFYRFLNITVLLETSCFVMLLLLSRKSGGYVMRENTNRFLVLAFTVAFFLTTQLSLPVWSLIPQFPFLQFPWRWIIVMELSLCFLIAGFYSGENVPAARSSRFWRNFLLILLTVLAQLPMQNMYGGSIHENDLAMVRKTGKWIKLTDDKLEYLPIWTTNLDRILPRDLEERVVTKSGRASTRIIEWDPESRTIEVRASSDSIIRLSTFYYPGWAVTNGERHMDIEPEKETGAILVHVPRGTHTIQAKFGDTRLRRMAKYASVLSLLFLIPVAVLVNGLNGRRGVRRNDVHRHPRI